jgi:hypothetical protein
MGMMKARERMRDAAGGAGDRSHRIIAGGANAMGRRWRLMWGRYHPDAIVDDAMMMVTWWWWWWWSWWSTGAGGEPGHEIDPPW